MLNYLKEYFSLGNEGETQELNINSQENLVLEKTETGDNTEDAAQASSSWANILACTSKLASYFPRQIAMALLLNGVRDLTWTALTYLQYDDKFDPDSNGNQQMLSQWIYASLAMVFAAVTTGAILYKRAGFTSKDAKETVIAFAAASAAVITWDESQTLGIAIGKGIGMTDIQAGYFASLFTGGAEGPTQFLVAFVGTLLLLPEDRRAKYTNDPCKGFARFLTELGFSVFPGAIPGGMWQVVYQGNPCGASTNDTSIKNVMQLVGGSFAVAGTVGFFNFCHVKAYELSVGKCFDDLPTDDRTSALR